MAKKSRLSDTADTHLESLHRIIKEIPSGVSAATLKETLNITKSPELLDFINNNIISSLEKTLDEVWVNLGISEKLHNLKKLQEKPQNEDTWRFETGVANINPIITHSLLKQKEELKQQLYLKKQQSELLKKQLEDTLKDQNQILKTEFTQL